MFMCREYVTRVTMTTKFSKTYTRKGGEANSKFEEVFGNRKAMLNTKWGETTYKAQLGSRRPAHTPDTSTLHKKARLERSDEADDPFGFDSDDEEQSEMSQGSEVEQGGQNAKGGANAGNANCLIILNNSFMSQ